MNYKDHYDRLIYRAKNRIIDGYVEKHHIIPKCMNGTNDKNNIVRLTAREHYIAHQLLIKIYPNVKGLVYAAIAMTGKCKSPGRKISNNRMYGWLRKKNSDSKLGLKLSETHKNNISNGIKSSKKFRVAMIETRGRKQSTDEKLKRINACKNSNKFKEINKGRKHSAEVIKKRAISNSLAQTGIKKSLEHKQALKLAASSSETKRRKSEGIKAIFAADPLFKIKRSLQILTWRAIKNNVPLSIIK